MKAKLLISLAAALLLAGCELGIFGPNVEMWARRPMEPVPIAYANLYAAVERCWGRQGDFAAVRWYVADKIAVNDTGRARGATDGNEITIARDYINADRTVMHEMSHHVSGRGDEIHWDGGRRATCDDASHVDLT